MPEIVIVLIALLLIFAGDTQGFLDIFKNTQRKESKHKSSRAVGFKE